MTHKTTKETIERVTRWTKEGSRQEDMAKALGITSRTLRKHYGDIMSICHLERNCEVGNVAYRMAISGKYPAMTRFWLKTQAGWRETDHTDDKAYKEPITKIEIETVSGEKISEVKD